MTYWLDEVALKEAEALAARQPRCDWVIPELPALPSDPQPTDLLAIYRPPQTYSGPVSLFIPPPIVPPLTYDQVVEATPGVIHFWPMNEVSSSRTLVDQVGDTNLVVSGNVQLGAPPVCNDGETTARWLGTPIGNGIPNGNAADFVALPGSVFPQGGPFSIEFIAADGYISGLVGAQQMMVCNGGLPSDTGFDLYINGGNVYGISGPNGGDGTAVIPNQARTVHFVMTYDGGNTTTSIRTYINGWWLTSASVSNYGSPFFAGGGFIGKSVAGTFPYVGRIGKLAIYTAALSQTTIFQHYNTGVNQ